MGAFIVEKTLDSRYSDVKQIKPNEVVCLYGIIHNIRLTKWGGFIILRKPIGLIQMVFLNDVSKIQDEEGVGISINGLSREMSIIVTGKAQETKIKDISSARTDIEIAIEKIQVLSRPSSADVADLNSLNFVDEESILRYKLDNRQVTLRNPKDIAIFKVSAIISQAFSEYLSLHGFTQIHTPKIVSEGAEGGANVFSMDYFGKKVYLAQSPQFYKQIAVGAFERVFEIAPAYRAEKHNTSRHLNEYISMDVEMGFIEGQEDVMELETGLLRFIIDKVANNCAHELSLMDASLPSLPFAVPVYKLSEVHDILYQNGLIKEEHRNEPDLAPEEEKAICKFAKENFDSDFVFVTHFPSAHRAFYAMDDPSNSTLTISYDLLMCGMEITSGGQRIHKEEEYRVKMRKRGMDPDNFSFYLDAFKNGMPPHGGFAIGLERITACFLGLSNIKEASLFVRDINRVAP